jgi:hypothetical protein
MIYAIAKVTIQNNYKATIDRPLIFYKGDKNIEVQFEIVESIFRQYKQEGSNTIDNLGASYGQLVIQRPNFSYALSEISETKEGRIVFVIPPEMTDENIDLGSYTFQIRLYDETQNSRVTLPPVVDGIVIYDSIVSEE